ncbi:unannotated protein [freshwater metagenome]|uniref:Unannotated protein n=1 Tax=freshwater metagenome TaxID=449393 RepID=A0A6J6FZR3_9ZZZZ|nr:hypothetical protein [Actinomycetota bacterium]
MSSRAHSRYLGRRACLATLHDKLDLIAPAMESHLGLEVFVEGVDTDRFGTFSGEVPRPRSAYETALIKARAGMVASDARFGLASEGSIGTNSFFPLVSDVEFVVFIDDEEGFEVAEQATSFDIVAHRWVVDDLRTDGDQLHRAGFPSHGLIVHPEDSSLPVFKGIHDLDELESAVRTCRSSGSAQVVIESDLRANHCPSRRPTIRRAAERLAERLTKHCPSCECPGWGPVDEVRGRKCAECRWPTNERLALVMGCCRCDLRRTDQVTTEPGDPSRCPRCNP